MKLVKQESWLVYTNDNDAFLNSLWKDLNDKIKSITISSTSSPIKQSTAWQTPKNTLERELGPIRNTTNVKTLSLHETIYKSLKGDKYSKDLEDAIKNYIKNPAYKKQLINKIGQYKFDTFVNQILMPFRRNYQILTEDQFDIENFKNYLSNLIPTQSNDYNARTMSNTTSVESLDSRAYSETSGLNQVQSKESFDLNFSKEEMEKVRSINNPSTYRTIQKAVDSGRDKHSSDDISTQKFNDIIDQCFISKNFEKLLSLISQDEIDDIIKEDTAQQTHSLFRDSSTGVLG